MKIAGFLLLLFALSLVIVTGCGENNNMLSQPTWLGDPPAFSSGRRGQDSIHEN